MPRTTFYAALLLAVMAGPLAAASRAQCATCPTPTVAYSPVVYQQTEYTGWYPGKYLGDFTRNLFSPYRSTYTTSYAPTAYTAGYAPTSYTAGYAPSTYSVGYRGAPTAYRAAYQPTYPVSYYAGYAPVVQSVYRPVTLQPVCQSVSYAPSACSGCSTGCSSCGVTTASYEPSYATGSSCSSCAPSASSSSSVYDYNSNQPSLAPEAEVPVNRQLDKPVYDEDDSVLNNADETSGAYFEAPKLFLPSDRTTKRPTAPVWTAVYEGQTKGRLTAHTATHTTRTAHRPLADQPVASNQATSRPAKGPQVGASGWVAVQD
ncbi:hypothetical protein Mal64_03910 [Pseudobythopirellula maris]|uniref:Uncharacterized protein n=1 Tax=Pseudobythopirellula maris TaxID=2527991 RepID=A0A5C5ZR86_9BACT|nr:hypothetical protein [Pseudobythopirellula maris]TWT90009.1 hypothetical protein Mal64_03910 [Pseudobythopirellula maris]